MSLDISLKPIGAAIAAPQVAPVSEAAGKAVATELPASQSVTATDKAIEARTNPPHDQPRQTRAPLPTETQSRDVIVDAEAEALVYRVLDTRTSLVVRQYPDEAMLRRRAYFHALDRNRDIPAKPQPVDLTA